MKRSNKIKKSIRKEVFKIKGSFRKNKGKSLIELMTALFIFVLVTLLINNIYSNTMNHYFVSRKLDNSQISLYEALMHIDYYVNFYGENHYIQDERLYVEAKNGKRQNYFYLFNSELRVAYKNESGNGYTSQPLLYGVEKFNLSENEKVIFVEIVTEGGATMRKAMGRI
ncbi:hypothetical protein [Clostridium culturomicium]|uniref:hypothetical protein n=1 Tax=Clostridium culturomicium TaxID=1499683 RepID=UPI00058DEE55|nr:hypothetical protein [Clostridium culturomicium]